MNPTAIYSKSGKGVQEASGKTSLLKRPDRAVLSAIDGRANLGEVAQKVGQQFDASFQQLVAQLDKEGFIREVTPGTAPTAAPRPATAKPRAAPTSPLDASSDLDFTTTLRTPARSAPPKPPDAAAQARAKEQEAALYRARQEAEAKAQAERDRLRAEAEAKARSEEEAKLRAEAERRIREEAEAKAKAKAEAAMRMVAEAKAKAEAEAKARIEAERKAREEVERAAQEAADRVRREAELKVAEARAKAEAEAERARREAEELRQRLEEERKAREQAERRAKEEEERLAREEVERAAREVERRRQEEAAFEAISRAREEEGKAAREAAKAAKEAEQAAKAEAKTKKEYGVGSLDALLTDLDSFSKREEQDRQEEKEAAARRDEEDRVRKARHAERRAQEEARRVKEEAEERQREQEREREREKREAEERRRRKDEEARARLEAELDREREEQERIEREEAHRKQEEEERKRKAREEEKAASRAVAAGTGEAYADSQAVRRRKDALLHSTGPARAERRKPTMGKPVATILFLLLVAGVGAVHVMPIATQEYEKLASAALGRPVKADSARVSLLTGVQLKFEGVTIGTGGKIALVRAHPEIGSLFGDKKAFSRIELEGVTLAQQAVGAALLTRVRGDGFRVGRIAVNPLKLEGPVPLPPLEVEALVGADGALRSVSLRGPDNLMGRLTPKGSEIEFDVTAAGFQLPFAPDITLTQFAMRGSANRSGMNIASWGGSILDGVIGGSARVRWGEDWQVDGALTARGVNAAVFAPALLSEGKAEANGRFSMSGADPARLARNIRVEGSFTVGKGVLGTFDLGRAIQTSGRQIAGRTQFSELYGQGVYHRGAVALRNVSIASGALNAGASADIAASGALNGRIVSDLRTPNQTVRLIMNLGGTVRDPQVRN